MSENTLGSKLAALRKERKISQCALERLSGISNSTISRLEKGESNGSPETWETIALALGVSISVFAYYAKEGISIHPVIEIKPVLVSQEVIAIVEPPKPVPIHTVVAPVVKAEVTKDLTGPKLVAACYEVINRLKADGYRLVPLPCDHPNYIKDFTDLIKSTILNLPEIKSVLMYLRNAGFEILCITHQRKVLGVQLNRFDYLPFGLERFQDVGKELCR